MIDQKGMLVGMDMDTALDLLPRDRYPYALNITRDATAGANKDGRTGNLIGNAAVSYSLPAGTNKEIGAFPLESRGLAYYMVYNSNGNHSVLEYNAATNAIAKVLESKTDTGSTDILNFTATEKISSISVLIREEGDLLFFLDSLGRPTVLDIAALKAGSYTPVTRNILDVHKGPPLSPPTAAYANDTARRTNNHRNKLYRYATRYVYDDYGKTSCSPVSKVPLPVSALDETYTSVITNNNRVNVTFPTGDKSVREVELLVAIADRSSDWGDWLLVKSFNKATESIGDDTTTTYAFYNDGGYAPIDQSESPIQHLFDWVPDLANAMDMPNGNVLAFAGITEGLDRTLTPNVTITVGTTAMGTPGAASSFVASVQDVSVGDHYYHSRLNLYGTPQIGTKITVKAKLRVNGNMQTIGEYTTLSGDTTADIVAFLIANVQYGFIIIDNSGTNFIDYALRRSVYMPLDATADAPDLSGRKMTVEVVPPASVGPTEGNSEQGWKWSSRRRVAMQYFTNKGKTNGVLYDAEVVFPAYSENGSRQPLVPTLDIKIRHQPPLWAESYTLLVNNDDSWFLYWHTASAYTDDNHIYFDISNFELNREKRPTVSGVLNYSFVDGDRMRLVRKTSDDTVYADTYDATVEGVVTDPTISNDLKKGRFLKIKKVSPFSALDYASGNYVVELYRVAQTSAGSNSETFYEVGEEYAILDAGLSTRRHAGGVSNQSLDLTTTPAETTVSGDVYFRTRNVFLTENGFAKFFVVDRNFVDGYPSAVSSCQGRPSLVDPSAKRAYHPTLIRFGGEFQQNTNINRLSRFYPNNYDEYNPAFGDVQRIAVRGQYLYVFQKHKIGNVPLFSQITRDSNGGQIAVVTDKLLNKIQYYMGEFGIGEAKESLARFNYAFYGCDTNKGVIWRLSQDGIQVLSELYGASSWASRELPLRTGTSKIYGAFDQKANHYIVALEAATGSAAQTILFSEKDNAFPCFASFLPEGMVTLGNLLISFKAGALYTHNSNTYNNFYGVQYTSKIQVVFNDKPSLRKEFKTISYEGSSRWTAASVGDIVTSEVNAHTGLAQISALIAADFEPRGVSFDAAFFRDGNSATNLDTALLEGDYLIGNYISVLLSNSGSTSQWLLSPRVSYEPHNRNY